MVKPPQDLWRHRLSLTGNELESELNDEIPWQKTQRSRKGLWTLSEDITGCRNVGWQYSSVTLGPHGIL